MECALPLKFQPYNILEKKGATNFLRLTNIPLIQGGDVLPAWTVSPSVFTPAL